MCHVWLTYTPLIVLVLAMCPMHARCFCCVQPENCECGRGTASAARKLRVRPESGECVRVRRGRRAASAAESGECVRVRRGQKAASAEESCEFDAAKGLRVRCGQKAASVARPETAGAARELRVRRCQCEAARGL